MNVSYVLLSFPIFYDINVLFPSDILIFKQDICSGRLKQKANAELEVGVFLTQLEICRHG